jgi:hypothetical protein
MIVCLAAPLWFGVVGCGGQDAGSTADQEVEDGAMELSEEDEAIEASYDEGQEEPVDPVQ